MKTPFVSVIIPTYNRGKYVANAIESVLSQTYGDYEVIVVDDGSTDNTKENLKRYGDRIKYIYQDNSGVSSARNAGIMHATGEWISFVDSDDEWNGEYLSTQILQIKKFPHAVAHIMNGVTIFADGNRSNLFAETKLMDRFKTKQCLILEKPLSIIVKYGSWFLDASIVRRDILLRAGLFDTHLSIAEDIDVFARVALEGPFTICRRELVEAYRREESFDSLSAQSVKRGIYRYRAFGKVYTNLLSSQGLTRVEKVAISRTLSSNWLA